MPLTMDEREEQLTQIAKRLIREMLDNEKPTGEIMLEDIEQAALQVGQEMQKAVASDMAAHAEEIGTVKCPSCGKGMGCQGKRSRVLVSEIGEITIERNYYYCRNCKEGFFPPR